MPEKLQKIKERVQARKEMPTIKWVYVNGREVDSRFVKGGK